MDNKKQLDEDTMNKLINKLKIERDKFYRQKEDFEKEKKEFELYKQEEEAKLKEKLLKEELEFRKNMEKEKIKVLNDLREEAKKEIEEVHKKLYEKEKLLEEKSLEIMEFENEKRNFEALKNEKLQKFEEELNSKKNEILSDYQKIQAEKLKELTKKQEEMFENIKKELKEKEDFLNKTQGELNQKQAQLEVKEEELELLKEEIKEKEKEKVREEMEYLQENISYLKEFIERLESENRELKEEIEKYSEFENIDELIEKIDEYEFEIKRLREKIDTVKREKNETISDLEEKINYLINEKDELLKENESMKSDNMSVLKLRNDNEYLRQQLDSLKHKNNFLESELSYEREKLNSIYAEGKELELRAKEIIEKPYIKEISEKSLDITDEKEYLKHIENGIKNYGIEYPKRLIYAFHTALKCADFSPLSILYGVSGTGKSELPKLYAYFGGFNFLAEPVQPTWDSPESMLGYFNTLENKFDATNILRFLFQTFLPEDENPYSLYSQMNIILLDEMNLAHIELYFAEFLSKFEQRRGSGDVMIDIKLGTNKIYNLPLKRNLLWIGTMNEDETTKSLSDKVLDRSYLINFPRPKELYSRKYLKQLKKDEFKYLRKDIWNSWIKNEPLDEKVIEEFKDITNEINQILIPTGRAIGHRVWQSMEFYMQNHPLVENALPSTLKEALKTAYEEQLVQKIMPKLRGIEVFGKEKDILNAIQNILIEHNLDIVEDFKSAMENPYGQFIWNSADYIFKEI